MSQINLQHRTTTDRLEQEDYKVKTAMLRSVGKQSRKSVVSVLTSCTNYFSFFITACRFVFRMRSSVLSDCFYFILFSVVSVLFLYTGQLLVHFVLALAAASRTVVSCTLHTLHSYFQLLHG